MTRYIGRHRIGNGIANAEDYFRPVWYTIEFWGADGVECWVSKNRNYLGRYIGGGTA